MAIGDKDYNVEFDDSVLGLKGWTNPRYGGCTLKSLYYNEYNGAGDNIKQIGTYQNANLESTIKLRLPETRYATGVLNNSYAWWKKHWRFLDAQPASVGGGNTLYGDPTIGIKGADPDYAFSDGSNTGGMGPRDAAANVTYSGIVKLGPEETFDMVPTIAYEGDDSYSVLPTIQNTTNTVFIGTKVLGFKEDELYPGPGPDYSYLIINKAITFDTDDDSFFIIENETDDDPTFEKLVQTNLPWASKFRLKLLDDAQPHNLKKQYGVHYNRGLFGWVAKYTAPYDTAYGDRQDDNGQWIRSHKSIYVASHDYMVLATKVYLLESASNRYQMNFPGSPFESPQASAYGHPQYYGYNITGSVNQISGSELLQADGSPPTEHTFNPVLRYTATYFEWVSRDESSPQGIGTEISDITGGPHGTNHQGGQLSGSIKINKNNKDINWWFQEGGRAKIKYMNPIISQSQNIKPQSFKRFIERICDNPNDKLYICTINDSLNCDHTFRISIEENNPDINSATLHPNSSSTLTQGTWTTLQNNFTKVSKPIVTFGSFPFDGRKVGVPGCSPNGIMWMNHRGNPHFEPNIDLPEGYIPQFLNYAQVSSHYAGSVDDTAGAPSWWGSSLYFAGNEHNARVKKIANAGDGLVDIYDLFTGSKSAQNKIIDAAPDDGYPDSPVLDNYTFSCLEERNNVILTNVNKKIDLSGGIGKKGFAIISEDLNPEIRQNLDYYLKKAELIDKGPKQKDRNLIKHKPRPGFFKKRKRNKK